MSVAPFDDAMTLGEARNLLRTLVRDGHRCPCCTQLAKIYRRKLNSAMAWGLIRAARRGGEGWFHVPSIEGLAKLGGDFGKLAYWGLVQEETEPRPDGGRAGYWRLTTEGHAFVRDGLHVRKYALVYDARCLALEGEWVAIRDCLGSRFNYEELMAA